MLAKKNDKNFIKIIIIYMIIKLNNNIFKAILFNSISFLANKFSLIKIKIN